VFNVRKPLEVSILERSEELRFYKKIWQLQTLA
jgi:hypothetical protein